MNDSEDKIESFPKDCIVLLAKQAGLTSFSSLYTIKHALNTKKIGHTGTLDSFAEGLLVVCCASLTRLAGKITEFDKTYQAVIQFGAETDTLEHTGTVVRSAPLPTKKSVENALCHFTGEIMQAPPAFSAIHINGKRASDVARLGKSVSIPARKITVYSSKILDLHCSKDNSHEVDAALVEFSVSKGTYIRSLARDIGTYCSSAAHLTGLFRTKVGEFSVADAAGFDLLEPFTIQRVKKTVSEYKNGVDGGAFKDEAYLQGEVIKKAIPMTRSLARQCGFSVLNLNEGREHWFSNGGKLSSALFDVSPFSLDTEYAAVFKSHDTFAGLLQKDKNGYFKYAFVVS